MSKTSSLMLVLALVGWTYSPQTSFRTEHLTTEMTKMKQNTFTTYVSMCFKCMQNIPPPNLQCSNVHIVYMHCFILSLFDLHDKKQVWVMTSARQSAWSLGCSTSGKYFGFAGCYAVSCQIWHDGNTSRTLHIHTSLSDHKRILSAEQQQTDEIIEILITEHCKVLILRLKGLQNTTI